MVHEHIGIGTRREKPSPDFPELRAGRSRWRWMTERGIAHLDRIWEVIGKAGICMMTTHFPDGLRVKTGRAFH
jgi:hypothetical protein